MGNYEEIISTSIANSGSTTATVGVSGYDKITVQLVGDSNSTNLDLTNTGKSAPQAVLGDTELAEKTGVDLTTNTNTSRIIEYDVEGYQTIEFSVANNAASASTVTAYIGYGEHR